VPKFQRHIFVCGNQREPGHPRGSCDPTAEGALQKLFKKKLADAGIRGDVVRANKSGCLEQCEHGPTVVVYPEAVWYGFVRAEDVDEIVSSHIVGGVPVERLTLPDSCLNTATCPHKPRR
jgi:(2Fe-2S) ferredoxin